MSTHIPAPVATASDLSGLRVAIITARWNAHITDELLAGALAELADAGVPASNITSLRVPGAVELVNAAAHIVGEGSADAVIVFGCVVRGDTPHFDYVCQSVTQGVTTLNSRGTTPVIFGLLTVNTEKQAFERIGGPHGHKGREAAQAAIEMATLWSD
ncbi:MAG: 6,7-dimethyl-8-ribityllumazine synthase [Paramuribaculum sp.]|nr:6,7-dimethyl-8-ribityllumazine synthase [Paramuribaculum sp.]